MDKKLSIKIATISFLLMLHVVVVHSVNINYDPNGNNIVWFIENFISFRLVKVVIPLFFFISGYLFFLSIAPGVNDTPNTFKEKIGKRFKTLGIPYLFWCTFWFAVIFILQLIPQLSSFFSTPLQKMTLWQQFWNLYIEPINYPLWFLRELLLYVMITPLLYWLVKKFKLAVPAVFFLLSLFYLGIEVLEIYIYRFHMLVYYTIGIYLAIHKNGLKYRLNVGMQILSMIVFLGICALLIWFDINNIDVKTWPIRLISNVATAIGVISVWSLYDYFDDRFHFQQHSVFSYGFIIYAMHGIPILYLKEALVKFFEPSKPMALVFYVVSFTSVILVCLFFGMMLKKLSPKIYLFTTGNR